MQHAGLKLLGVFLKTHGIKGELVLKLTSSIANEFIEGEPVFVEIDGIPVPFFIARFNIVSDDTAIVSFDETPDEKLAEEFIGCRLFAENGKLESETDGDFDIGDLEGYIVVDEVFGETGTLTRIIEMPENPVMSIDREGKEILVPFHGDIITSIDNDNKVIYISAPEGLLDLYL